MAITLATGTTVQCGSVLAAALAFTTNAGSNAAEAVLLMASTTGLAAGDYVYIATSGWGRMQYQVHRIKTVTPNTSIVLEAVNTTDTDAYPQNSGGGTLQKITTWTTVTQLTEDISIGGGEQEWANATTLDDRLRKQIPKSRSPISAKLNVFYDATLPWFAIVKALSDASAIAPVMFVYPNKSRTLAGAYWSMLDVPTINDSTLRGSIDLGFAALPKTLTT